jgi:predicted ATPase/DNA-binding CsgD family transcriptional regulator
VTPEAEHTLETGAEAGNLPAQLTALLGRDDALAELRPLLWGTRLLTLTGPGGAGKSRLASALADSVRADFVGGAWWADLAWCVDEHLVAQTVAATVLPATQVGDPLAALARELGSPSLLVLDNCEQVAFGTGRFVAELLARAPALRVVTTSRQSLGVPGEQLWRVAGLPLRQPGTDGGPAGRRDVRGPAVRLFEQRAGEALATFAGDDPETRRWVIEICRWLDGIPLAIELAAARVTALSVEQIAERLQRDSGLLRNPSRAASGRHRTLQDTLEWSHQLLDSPERALLRRLGAFHGNFSLAAAETVGAGDGIEPDEVLDLLTTLIDQSLVQVVESPSTPRYRLLRTVRQYAVAKLRDCGELDDTLRRHARFYRDLGPRAHAGLTGADALAWVESLELDHDNLSEALRWLIAHDPGAAAGLAGDLWPFYYQRGYYSEARGWFAQVLAHRDELDHGALVDTLLKAGELAFLQCDYAIAVGHMEQALELIGPDGDPSATAIALQRLGSIAREQGRYGESLELHERSMAIWSALGDGEGIASSQSYIGFCAWLSGDFTRAETACTTALEAFRAQGNLRDVAAALINLGAAAQYAGELDRAAERLDEALAISRRLGFQEGIAWTLHERAILARRRRQADSEPELMLRDALLVHQQLGDRWRISSVLDEIAASALTRSDSTLAARLLGCGEALRERIETIVPPAEAGDHAAAVAKLRRQLTPAGLEAAWAEGRALALDRAIELAVAALEEHDGSAARAGPGGQGIAPILTSRELAVLDLLCRGHTNREIAATLFISPSTAGVHVSNILRKLRAKRRVDAAGRAHALGLLESG